MILVPARLTWRTLRTMLRMKNQKLMRTMKNLCWREPLGLRFRSLKLCCCMLLFLFCPPNFTLPSYVLLFEIFQLENHQPCWIILYWSRSFQGMMQDKQLQADVRHAAELELESAIAGKNRRRRSRRRRRTTTTTTTTVDCGSDIESYSIGWDVTGSVDYCVEGLNTGSAVESINSDKCSESTRDKWLFVDQGNGYCTLVAQYNDGHRRRNHKGTSVTCGTSSMSVAYCKVNGNQGYTKLKLEDLGNNKFKMWWYDSSGTARYAARTSGYGGGGIVIADYSNGDHANFRLYKNAVYSNTCRLTKSDLDVTCWKW